MTSTCSSSFRCCSSSMTAAPKFAARLPPPEMASAKKRSSLVSSGVSFHEAAVSGGESLDFHFSFHPGRQLPGSTAQPPITSRRPTMQTLTHELLRERLLEAKRVLNDVRMNGGGKPDAMHAS